MSKLINKEALRQSLIKVKQYIDDKLFGNSESLKDLISEEISKGLSTIVDSAPEAFDTLKEVADWITQDETHSAIIIESINKNTQSINEIKNTKADSALSLESENPVMNKILTARFNGIDTRIDSLPTKLSQFTDDVVAGKYLPLSGGTISGGPGALEIKRNGPYLSYIKFSNTNGTLGELGFVWANNPAFFHTDGNYYTLYHTGNFNPANYLPLSGGTISSNSYAPLFLDTTDTQCRIQFRVDKTDKAIVGYNASYGAWLYNYASSAYIGIKDDGTPNYNSNTLIHAGNVGSYALKVDGSNKMGVSAYINWATDEGREDYSAYNNGIRLLGYNPSTGDYTGGIHIGTRYGWQLVRDGYTDTMKIRYRSVGTTTWNDWKTIAFTDSDITGNAGSATKLQTPRTIWGQSFDGSGNVSGNIQGGKANFTIYGYNSTSASNVNILTHDNNKSLWLGYGMNAEGNATIIAGTDIEFRYGTSRGTAAFINSSGNVGIGTTDPAYKLEVNGDTHISGNLIVDGTITPSTASASYSLRGGTSNKTVVIIEVGSTEETIEHGLGADVAVSLYARDTTKEDSWVLTSNGDIEITDTAVIVTFDNPTIVEYKVVIVG